MRLRLGLLATILFAIVGARTLTGEDAKPQTTSKQDDGKSKAALSVDPLKDLPHYPPVEPKSAVATWKIKKGFHLELAAHEPQVRSPIAICFDERGRMFVCEMIDYSELRETSPHLGRTSMLEDKDGDGYYETSTVFADNLPWPTGVIWANGGLYIAATPDIWRFEDRDGDGKAEVRKKIFTGFGSGLTRLNVQGLLNSFQWGQDNRIHVLAGGGNRGVVSCVQRQDLPGQELAGNDFWFDPLTHEFGLENGGAQYGMSFDNFGRKFGCSNSDHLQYWVYDGNPGARNPMLPFPPWRQSIAVDGGAAEVFRISPDEPWRILRTRWRVSGVAPGVVEGGGRVSGYFTGATGTTIYRGDAYSPEFVNNSFTGDAGGQLVHRKRIMPAEDGVNLIGKRPEDERDFEFAASADTWVRVVNFANAPDGCLYVMDMYREVIEHPWSIPEEIKKHLDLNQGNDRGRIYRIVPDKGVARIGQKVSLDKASSEELVKLLGHGNGWHRDTAQRLLYERQDKSVVPKLASLLAGDNPLAKLHALGALEGLKSLEEKHLLSALSDVDSHVRERSLQLLGRGALHTKPGEPLIDKISSLADDPDPRVRFQLALTLAALLEKNDSPELVSALVRLAEKDHAHPWIGPAVLSAPQRVLSHELFAAMTKNETLASQASPFIAKLIEVRAATEPAGDRQNLVRFVAKRQPNVLWLRALGNGLRRAGTTIQQADAENRLDPIFKQAAADAGDGNRSVEVRLEAIELLGFAALPEARAALATCLAAGQPDSIQMAAITTISQQPSVENSKLLLGNWPNYRSVARERLLQVMISRPDRLSELLAAIQFGAVPAKALSAAQVQSLIRNKDVKIAALAKSALASVIPPSRAEAVAKFKEAVTTTGDAGRGQAQFVKRCSACHRAADQGISVGPDLITVKSKGREALLTAILEPNKEVAPQYIQFNVSTKDGASYTGIVIEDNAAGMTLKLSGGATQTIQRSQIEGVSSSGLSMMPEGIENGMTVPELADLMTFIESLK